MADEKRSRRKGSMAANRAVSEIVTYFFFNTCQVRQQVNMDYTIAFMSSVNIANDLQPDDHFVIIPLTTGSVAEFYIRPMFSCVGDVDVMYHSGSRLAIPAGTAPPTQLPSEFDSHVIVSEIIDSEFCLLYTSPSPRDGLLSRMPSSA